MLARPELEQLAQRVIARYHLGPLSEPETGAYIAHRMAVAGFQGAPVFASATVALVHRITHGVPRRINLLCDRALLGAYVENSRGVTRKILRTAAADVFAGEAILGARPLRWPLVAGGVLAGAALSAAAAWQVLPHGGAPVRDAALVSTPPSTSLPAARPVAKIKPAATVPAPKAGELAGQADEAGALRALAGLWGETLAAGEPCQAGLRLNLRCHQGKGGIFELRQLDRPAVITLRDGASTSYAVVVGMYEQAATVLVNGKRQRVDLAALALRFTGELTTFWKVARSFRDQLAVGDEGPDVDWLAAQLARLENATPPPAQQPFSARTQERLRAFQTQQNLKADGVAGPRTWMRLNQLSGVSEPRLLAAARTGH